VNRERRRTSCSGNDPQEGVRSRQRVSGSWVGLVVSAGSAEGSVDSSVNGKIAFGRFDAANGGNPHSRSTRTARARPRCRSPGQEPLLGARRHTLVIAHVDFDSRKRARDDAVALWRQ
jgi:hypothetical protein